MKLLVKSTFITLFFIAVFQGSHAQRSTGEERLRSARILMSDYIDASLFRDLSRGGYDPSWENIFRNVFDTDKIIFDVPLRANYKTNETQSLLESGKEITRHFQEVVTIDQYIELMRIAYQQYDIANFHYQFTEIRFDTLILSNHNKLYFEFRKSFENSAWSVKDSRNYVFEVSFTTGQPKISSVRPVDENIAKTNVKLTFVNSKFRSHEPGYLIPNMVSQLNILFDESINNTSLKILSDSLGVVNLGLVASRAVLRIDTAYIAGGDRYSVPTEWRIPGMRVNSQPPGGFIVPILPWRWNGFSWSARTGFGLIGQSGNDLSNFRGDSRFQNKTGFKYGVGVEFSKLFELGLISSVMDNILKNPQKRKDPITNKSHLGLGSGIWYYSFQYRITSNGFIQNIYRFADRFEVPVDILISGNSFTESVNSQGVALPLFLEFRRKAPFQKQILNSVSVQAGLNFMIPFKSEYTSSGTLSRHGFYANYNIQPMISDAFYNYYTGLEKSYSNILQYNSVLAEWMIRINGLISTHRNRSNLLDVGMMMSFPFSRSTSQNPGEFLIASGNDSFSSIGYSKKKVYNYYFGLSLGYNFINYRIY